MTETSKKLARVREKWNLLITYHKTLLILEHFHFSKASTLSADITNISNTALWWLPGFFTSQKLESPFYINFLSYFLSLVFYTLLNISQYQICYILYNMYKTQINRAQKNDKCKF